MIPGNSEWSVGNSAGNTGNSVGIAGNQQESMGSCGMSAGDELSERARGVSERILVASGGKSAEMSTGKAMLRIVLAGT
jgi:hypothetical protein